MLGYLVVVELKADRCRILFTNLFRKWAGHLNSQATEKGNLVLLFLGQSERSYVIREHELKKLVKERETLMEGRQ